jgi:hypothetical protein
MNPIAEDILMHYGMPKRSGRYPWGSGEDPYQHNRDFLSRVEELKKQGFTYTDENGKVWTGENAIAKSMGLTTGQYRNEKTIAKDQRKLLDIARAKSLQADGLGPTEITRQMGLPPTKESTVRGWLKPDSEKNMELTKQTVDFLKEQTDKKRMVDVGVDVERELKISKERLDLALHYLETREGYHVYGGRMPQVTNPGQKTTLRVLCTPDTEHKEIYQYDKIQTLKEYVSHDGGETFDKFVYPKSMDSKRLMVRYADDVGPDGARGIDKDGIVEIRRGVDDLSLGDAHYAQVRILVDDKKYIKGMAVYSDDMPDGVDIVFNTNKTKDVSKMDVLKDIKNDPDNPFGSLIKAGGQSYYTDKDGNRQLSLINKRADEGDWTEWADALPSQFLGKQALPMIKKQLNLAKVDKLAEYEEYSNLTNPTLKKHMLQKFADECDSAAVHLKAAALPGQKYHVIIPINTLKDNEIYAPQYKDGTELALVRYPHGGTFEIPILKVVNKHEPAKKIIGTTSIDAVGINKSVADRLSGADFDGDTVMCIPTNDKGGKVKVTSTKPLKDLEGFDPKLAYPERKGMKYMKDPVTGKDNTQKEMGVISNLITDMTLLGAKPEELARAVKHSMVVIDAGKHKLDYKKSEVDNNIAALKKEYQIHVNEDGTVKYGGAATLLSRAKGQQQVDKRQGTPKVNMKDKSYYDPNRPEGALLYKTADDLYYVKKGKLHKKHDYSTQMAETDDANTLVSQMRNPKELAYADYANSMKALANQARKEMMSTKEIEYSASAKEVYQAEVKSLMDKLDNAKLNTPRERAAQRLANAEVEAKKAAAKEAGETMKKSDIKKVAQQALTKYRAQVSSVSRKNRNIDITDREWEAIQAGAISSTQLKKILNNTDIDKLRERATPRTTKTLSPAKVNKIKSMQNSNYTIAEIARALGVSTSTVSNYLKGA